MTTEKVERANQLLEWIRKLENQRSRWESSKSIYKLELSTATERCRSEIIQEVDKYWVNFEDLKLLAISRISKRIEELQIEFDNL